MKKLVILAIGFSVIFTLSSISYAARFEKVGEYYRYFDDDGSVARNEIVEVDRKKYYLNDEGYAVFNSWVTYNDDMYYAGDDAVLKTDGAYNIAGYKYYLDTEGRLKKGWSDDYLYYGDLEDGFLLNGFQELEIPRDWATEENKERTGWFYFDTQTCKRVFADDDPYICKMIGNKRYCFDQNGIIRTGWRLIKETVPVMKGYMYFVEETNDEFKFGEAVTDTWYAVEPPFEVTGNSEVRYFYFNGQGQPRVAPVGKYIKVRLGEKTFLFNEHGYAVYGIHDVNGDYYYFGTSVQDCSMKTGAFNKDLDGSNDGASYFFEADGKGFTGVKNNKLYYKGKLQMATPEQKYAGIEIGGRAYLVNSSGTLMKNKRKIKDGDGCWWTTTSAGTVSSKDDGAEFTVAMPPDLSEDK